MSIIKRLLGLVIILLAFAFLLACIYAIGKLWLMRTPVRGGIDQVSQRIQETLKITQGALAEGEEKLNQGSRELANIQTLLRPLESGKAESPALRALVSRIEAKLQPQISQAREKVAFVQTSALLVDRLLDSLQDLPWAKASKLDGESLQRLGDRLRDLTGATKKLEDVLNTPDFLTQPERLRQLQNALTAINGILSQVRDALPVLKGRIEQTTEEVQQFQDQLQSWINIGLIVLTSILGWLGLSQFAMLRTGGRWLFRQNENAPGK